MKYLFCLVMVGLGLVMSWAQNTSSHFKYDVKKLPIHQMQVYEKSNLDGSRAGFVAVYLKNEKTIESFKWTPGNREGTLVIAKMDWSRFSVAEFVGGRLHANGEVNQSAELFIAPRSMEAQVEIRGMEPSTVALAHFPWHSYDFDFASLGMMMTQKVSSTTPFEFMISDIVRTSAGPVFGEIGAVRLEWQKEELKFDQHCQRYSIDGPGLDHKGGDIWFDEQGRLVGYEIQKPDEPGYESGKLRRVEVKTITIKEWEAFKIRKLGNS